MPIHLFIHFNTLKGVPRNNNYFIFSLSIFFSTFPGFFSNFYNFLIVAGGDILAMLTNPPAIKSSLNRWTNGRGLLVSLCLIFIGPFPSQRRKGEKHGSQRSPPCYKDFPDL